MMKGLYAIHNYNYHYPPLSPLQTLIHDNQQVENKPLVQKITTVFPIQKQTFPLYDQQGNKRYYGTNAGLKEDVKV